MSLLARLFCLSHNYVRAGDYLVCKECGHKVKVKA